MVGPAKHQQSHNAIIGCSGEARPGRSSRANRYPGTAQGTQCLTLMPNEPHVRREARCCIARVPAGVLARELDLGVAG